jgi:hypothetical protein
MMNKRIKTLNALISKYESETDPVRKLKYGCLILALGKGLADCVE